MRRPASREIPSGHWSSSAPPRNESAPSRFLFSSARRVLANGRPATPDAPRRRRCKSPGPPRHSARRDFPASRWNKLPPSHRGNPPDIFETAGSPRAPRARRSRGWPCPRSAQCVCPPRGSRWGTVTAKTETAGQKFSWENFSWFVEKDARGKRRLQNYLKVFFRNANPFTAISSRRGSIFRQIAAARAMTATSCVNDSITTAPL